MAHPIERYDARTPSRLGRRERSGATPAPVLPRLHWIDWLRVAAIAGVVIFHTLRPFDATDWHVKNAETNDLLGAVQIFLSSFGLAALFLLAGAGVQFALRKRTWRTFLSERSTRLLVPFVVGTLMLSPIQAGIEAAADGTAASALPDFLGWWAAAPGVVLDQADTPAVNGLGYHLWFLGFLFAFSVLGLPVFAALRSQRGTAAVDALARWVAAWPGSTIAFAAPIATLLLAGAALGVEEHGWHEFGQYFAYFVIGYVLIADERFLQAVRRDAVVAGAVLLATVGALIAFDFVGWLLQDTHEFDVRSLAMALLFAIEGWAATLLVLNIGLRARALQRPVPPGVGDAVLPVYVIHQPVILAVAFFVVQWPVGILPKWLVVFGLSAVFTLTLVELALRTPFTRILLGARQRPSTPVVPAPSRPTTDQPLIAPARSNHARAR